MGGGGRTSVLPGLPSVRPHGVPQDLVETVSAIAVSHASDAALSYAEKLKPFQEKAGVVEGLDLANDVLRVGGRVDNLARGYRRKRRVVRARPGKARHDAEQRCCVFHGG